MEKKLFLSFKDKVFPVESEAVWKVHLFDSCFSGPLSFLQDENNNVAISKIGHNPFNLYILMIKQMNNVAKYVEIYLPAQNNGISFYQEGKIVSSQARNQA